MIVIEVSAKPIDLTELALASSDTAHGATVLFVGAVRETNFGRSVRAVAYDAFEPLAEKVLRKICVEAQSKWGASLRFFVFHRTGEVTVGEASVAILATATHRDEAYQASRYIIEQLKIRAPIWKKEIYVDGESEWLKGHALCGHAG
ncbi:MAG: molybdenum cofactor biosynthesis protein MoaE [Deltaproteobacteria bacterium]|nr:molybdenum cofactor biosynthesis protein MoaE [Deltaproteobacteria bacterium]